MLADSPTPRRKRHFLRWLIVLFVLLFAWAGWRVYAFQSALAKAKELGWMVDYTSPDEVIRQNWKAAFQKDIWLAGVAHVVIPLKAEFQQHIPILYRLNPRALTIWDSSTFRDLTALSPLTRLNRIELINCHNLSNLDALKQHTALQVITLFPCTGLTNVEALQHLPALRIISLHKCTRLTNVNALKHLPALKNIYLTGSDGLTSVDSLMHLTNLEIVELTNCRSLTNVDSLMHLQNLRTVDLTGCTGLTKETIAALKAALPNAIINHD